jgi:hypothetical protein
MFQHGAKSLVNLGVYLAGQKTRVLARYERDAMIFFTFFLTTIDPAHHIYNIQLNENVF